MWLLVVMAAMMAFVLGFFCGAVAMDKEGKARRGEHQGA